MNFFSCGAVNACAQHDDKSGHEAEMHEFILMRRSERVCSTLDTMKKRRHEAEMHEFILMPRSECVCLLPPPTPPPTPSPPPPPYTQPPTHPPPRRGATEKQLNRRETTRRPVAALATNRILESMDKDALGLLVSFGKDSCNIIFRGTLEAPFWEAMVTLTLLTLLVCDHPH